MKQEKGGAGAVDEDTEYTDRPEDDAITERRNWYVCV